MGGLTTDTARPAAKRDPLAPLLALGCAALAAWLASLVGAVRAGEILAWAADWVPSLGVRLSFRLDGLSLLFGLLISGIGALVFVFSAEYLAGHPHLRRFNLALLLFTGAMLGTVFADNLLLLYVFWELTGIASFFLIGFEHERPAARAAAWTALLVTSAGGLAMLAGVLLLGSAAGSLELSSILARAGELRHSPLLGPAAVLILLGALAKSAQFPFHFWLPQAMEAPTPVSAFLHSATMVKAGIYLIARLSPVFAGTQPWAGILVSAGLATLAAGSLLAIRQKDLKQVLAHSTVAVLGLLTVLMGLGSPAAIDAALLYVLVHALYKGALFLTAGCIDSQAGTRDLRKLGGLLAAMPMTGAAALAAAASMAGLPPTSGFIAKEAVFEAVLAEPAALPLLALLVPFSALLVVAAAMVAISPLFGPRPEACEGVREAAVALWLPPAVLAAAGLAVSFMPAGAGELLSAAAAAAGSPAAVEPALWHGFNDAFALGLAALIAGALLFRARGGLVVALGRGDVFSARGPARCYELAVSGLDRAARLTTLAVQDGSLRRYLARILGTAAALVLLAALSGGFMVTSGNGPTPRFHEAALCVFILACAGAAAVASSRWTALAALGGVGYAVALLFALFSAPDLAMTQFAVESLTVIVFVLAMYRLPESSLLARQPVRPGDAAAAFIAGGLVSALVYVVASAPSPARISAFFIEKGPTEAHGHNLVNVILVDFRGFDTLGEISVLAVAALGVHGLLKLYPKRGERI